MAACDKVREGWERSLTFRPTVDVPPSDDLAVCRAGIPPYRARSARHQRDAAHADATHADLAWSLACPGCPHGDGSLQMAS